MARILVVDDEPEIVSLTKWVLEEAGHEVVEAESGEEGLKILEKDRPDLILLDVIMPEPNGWEVCKKIKTDKNLRDIPVAMFTVRTNRENVKKSMKSGADAHINKAFVRKELKMVEAKREIKELSKVFRRRGR